MQRIWALVLTATILGSCGNGDDQYFTVKGKFSEPGVKKVYLHELPIGLRQRTIIDSADVGEDGSFTLTAQSVEETAYGVYFGSDYYPVVINDVDEVNLVISPTNREELYTVSGSPASEALKNFFYDASRQLFGIYRANVRLDSLQRASAGDSLMDDAMKQRLESVDAFEKTSEEALNKAESPALSLYMLGYIRSQSADPRLRIEGYDNQEVITKLEDLRKKFPEHEGVTALLNQLNQSSKAPDFTLPDTEGNPVSLSSFRGSYVLVDFWASWCKPCREENPNLVKAFEKYHNRNFTILGVSLDQRKEAWLQAIRVDGLTWPQVSDLQYWNSKVVPLYGIRGIPYNVLLDPEGNIIAEGLRGADLERKLEEALK